MSLRVSLPLDPYFKTASEVATLAVVHDRTSIPTPTVSAFDASFNNDLGFEWMLMERLPGQNLESAWESFS